MLDWYFFIEVFVEFDAKINGDTLMDLLEPLIRICRILLVNRSNMFLRSCVEMTVESHNYFLCTSQIYIRLCL
jgi:hypothetical protein